MINLAESFPKLGSNGRTYLVAKLRDELLVARKDVRAVLDEAGQGPEAQWRLPVLLDDVQMRPVQSSAHLARLLDDRVDALRERVVEQRQRGLRNRHVSISVLR